LTGDVAPDMQAVAHADVIVTTPEKWDGISRSWQTRSYVKAVTLLVIDEIHLLGMVCFRFTEQIYLQCFDTVGWVAGRASGL